MTKHLNERKQEVDEMKEFFEGIQTLPGKISPTVEILIILVWIKILFAIEKKSRERNDWANIKALMAFISTIGAFFLGLFWLGPDIARLPNVEYSFGPLTKGSALAIRIPVAALSSTLNTAIIVLIEMLFDEKQRKADLKELRRQELEKIWAKCRVLSN
jgi:uncharacterized membrane protein YfcA